MPDLPPRLRIPFPGAGGSLAAVTVTSEPRSPSRAVSPDVTAQVEYRIVRNGAGPGGRAGQGPADRRLRRPPRAAAGRPQRGPADQGGLPDLRRRAAGHGHLRLRGQAPAGRAVPGDGGRAQGAVPPARAGPLLRGRGLPGLRLAPPHAQVPRRRAARRARRRRRRPGERRARSPSRRCGRASGATATRRSSWSRPTTSRGPASSPTPAPTSSWSATRWPTPSSAIDDTLHVDIDVMAHHTAAVARAEPHCLILGDMPWMSYHLSPEEAVRNAATLVRAGAQAVKLEGGRARLAGGRGDHPGRDPGHGAPRPHAPVGPGHGRFRVQGKSVDAAGALLDAAKALAAAGCFGFVIEGVPDVVGAAVTEALDVPTIGIGAGPACDGQVLVFHDLLGLGKGHHAEVRAPVRRPRPHRHRGHRRLRRRRAQRELPGRRRDLPRPRRAWATPCADASSRGRLAWLPATDPAPDRQGPGLARSRGRYAAHAALRSHGHLRGHHRAQRDPGRARPGPGGHPHHRRHPRRHRPLGPAQLRLRGEPQARGLLRRGGVHRPNPRPWPRWTACSAWPTRSSATRSSACPTTRHAAATAEPAAS